MSTIPMHTNVEILINIRLRGTDTKAFQPWCFLVSTFIMQKAHVKMLKNHVKNYRPKSVFVHFGGD